MTWRGLLGVFSWGMKTNTNVVIITWQLRLQKVKKMRQPFSVNAELFCNNLTSFDKSDKTGNEFLTIKSVTLMYQW